MKLQKLSRICLGTLVPAILTGLMNGSHEKLPIDADASVAAEERCPENLKTMLDTANCMATETEILAERIHDFLFGIKNCGDRGNQKEPRCFRDALQDQIELCSQVNKQLQEICIMLGA